METPWLSQYQAGIPATIQLDEHASLVSLFQHTCEQYPENIAFENFGHAVTYRTLADQVQHFAAFLQQNGLQKGDRVAIMLPNTLQYPIAILGILQAGGVVVNTNPLYTAAELTHQLKDADISFILVLRSLTPLLQQALPALPALKKIILTDIGDCLPWFKRMALRLYLRYVEKMSAGCVLPNTVEFRAIMQQSSPFQPVALTIHDLAFLQYTGGTTGVSKGAMLTHGNMHANVLQAYSWISPIHIGPDDIVVTALPLYHIFALTANCFTFIKAGAKTS